MRAVFLVAALGAVLASGAKAQTSNLYCQNINGQFVPASPSNPCPVTGASASSPSYTKPAPYTSLGNGVLAVSGTAVAITSTTLLGGGTGVPAGATIAYITASTNGVNYTDVGTAPTAAVTGGIPINVGGQIIYNATGLSALQFIALSGTANLAIWFGK